MWMGSRLFITRTLIMCQLKMNQLNELPGENPILAKRKIVNHFQNNSRHISPIHLHQQSDRKSNNMFDVFRDGSSGLFQFKKDYTTEDYTSFFIHLLKLFFFICS